nr:RNA-directed DNA polymerase, eukaryota [Tanacetum cinerariifolium]
MERYVSWLGFLLFISRLFKTHELLTNALLSAQTNKNGPNLKDKTFPFYEKLSDIFGKERAMGSRAVDLSELHIDHEIPLSERGMGSMSSSKRNRGNNAHLSHTKMESGMVFNVSFNVGKNLGTDFSVVSSEGTSSVELMRRVIKELDGLSGITLDQRIKAMDVIGHSPTRAEMFFYVGQRREKPHGANGLVWETFGASIVPAGTILAPKVSQKDSSQGRYLHQRFGSNFNEHGAHLFNSFISDSGLVEVPLGGCHFTWSFKTAKKMSKLDRFLVSKNLLVSCPHLTAVTLERYLSDHRPILLREYQYDYGPTPFRFFHHWMQTDGFDKIVLDSWKNSPSGGANDIKNLMYKLKHLKHDIREWNKHNIVTRRNTKTQYKKKLEAVDQILDSGQGAEEDIRERSEIIRKLQNCDEIDSLELAQKAKIQWAIEGDENSKF